MTPWTSVDEYLLDLLEEDEYTIWELAYGLDEVHGVRAESRVDEARNALKRLLGIGFIQLIRHEADPPDPGVVLSGSAARAALEDDSQWVGGVGTTWASITAAGLAARQALEQARRGGNVTG